MPCINEFPFTNKMFIYIFCIFACLLRLVEYLLILVTGSLFKKVNMTWHRAYTCTACKVFNIKPVRYNKMHMRQKWSWPIWNYYIICHSIAGRTAIPTSGNLKLRISVRKQITLNVVRFLLGNSPASDFQTPGNYPEESMQHSEHGESLKSGLPWSFLCVCVFFFQYFQAGTVP